MFKVRLVFSWSNPKWNPALIDCRFAKLKRLWPDKLIKKPMFRATNLLLRGNPQKFFQRPLVATIQCSKFSAESKDRSIDEIIRNIDTTLTPDQRIYVDKIKKQIKGGPKAERCGTFFFFKNFI
jgi:hypothetical protein